MSVFRWHRDPYAGQASPARPVAPKPRHAPPPVPTSRQEPTTGPVGPSGVSPAEPDNEPGGLAYIGADDHLARMDDDLCGVISRIAAGERMLADLRRDATELLIEIRKARRAAR